MSEQAVESPDQSSRRVVVVTGAGRGIGAATAVRFADQGHPVMAAARSADELATVAARNGNITPSVVDVGEERDVERLAAEAAERGPIGVWVNNAAILENAVFEDLTAEVWRRTLRVDLDGVFYGCRAAFLRMRERGGVIINIASLSGVANVEKFPGLAAYDVAKAGVIALTEAIALEGRQHGVVCIAVSPGAVDTRMLRESSPDLRPGMTPEQLAAIVTFLASPTAAPLSGTNIPIFSNA